MSSLYIHIPFCRKACSYCDFHFSVNHHKIQEVVNALVTEIGLRKNYLQTDSEKPTLQTVYFGGGTPSLLNLNQLNSIFEEINQHYFIQKNAEITLEANPDDITTEWLNDIKQTPINRLSIGVQSFFDEDLQLMNRVHTSEMAKNCVSQADEAGFKNITIDLIYGVPGMTPEKWNDNMEIAFALPVQHLSCYSLTVEKKTALDKLIREGKVGPINDELATSHFIQLIAAAEKKGFDHYEISNFARPGFEAVHNSNYWKNIPYLGIGPSAHSYNGVSRQWNISSNAAYVNSINRNEIPAETEILSIENRYNEYLMTGLRTKWGVDLNYIRKEFGHQFENNFLIQMSEFITSGEILKNNTTYTLSKKGKLLADKIASHGFVIK